jgi:prolyl-tRNA synthetase
LIHRRSQFSITVLRQAPAGLDRLTATAARGGLLRVGPTGLAWQPFGRLLVDRIQGLLAAGTAGLDRPEVRFSRSPALDAARSLKEAGGLGLQEWSCASPDPAAADVAAREVERGLEAVWASCGLAVSRTEIAAGSAMWHSLVEEGSERLLHCDTCGYTAPTEWAEFRRPARPPAAAQAVREVLTPGATTIKSLCAQLAIEPSQTLKALFLTTAEGETLLLLVRGDLDLSPEKLAQAIATAKVAPASPEAVATLGVVPGFAGPVGLKPRTARDGDGVWIVADLSLNESSNLVTGANREGLHLAGVNYPRDFSVTEILDVARAPAGAGCVRCDGRLEASRGFLLASRRSGAVETASADQAVDRGITLTAFPASTVAAVIARAATAQGLRFPTACAPFALHAILLPGGVDVVRALEQCSEAGLEILLDDREASAGVKFADADWIGAPFRVVAGRKSTDAGGVELTGPGRGPRIVAVEDLAPTIQRETSEVM